MFFVFLFFELSVALDCNQFEIRKNIGLSRKSKIKRIHVREYRKELCSFLMSALYFAETFSGTEKTRIKLSLSGSSIQHYYASEKF